MAHTVLADSDLITENPLGLATIINVYGMLSNGREFGAILYTTAIHLDRACFQKTAYLNGKVRREKGLSIRYAEYSFNEQFKIGAQAAREAKASAIAELRNAIPKGLILHTTDAK